MSNDNWFGVEPPRDAAGKVIPLDTEILYGNNGLPFYISDFRYSTNEKEWFANGRYARSENCWYCETNDFLLIPSDSWEKLEEDALKDPCRYFRMFEDQSVSCTACPHGPWATDRTCGENMRLDMIERAKKLAGVEEQEGE